MAGELKIRGEDAVIPLHPRLTDELKDLWKPTVAPDEPYTGPPQPIPTFKYSKEALAELQTVDEILKQESPADKRGYKRLKEVDE